jgi:hypothetical protein
MGRGRWGDGEMGRRGEREISSLHAYPKLMGLFLENKAEGIRQKE